MNPSLNLGLAHQAVRKLAIPFGSREIDPKEIMRVRQVGERFHQCNLGKITRWGYPYDVFSCSDKEAFLERIGVSDIQRQALEDVELTLHIREEADSGNRCCTLMATDPVGQYPGIALPVMEVWALHPERTVTDVPLWTQTEGQTFASQVEPGSDELTDIEAMANFFLPTTE